MTVNRQQKGCQIMHRAQKLVRRRPLAISSAPRVEMVALSRIMVAHNSRIEYSAKDDTAIEELASTVKRVGILEPLIGRCFGDKVQLAFGQRRLMAARQAGLKTVPVQIRRMTDAEMLELGIIENVQRKDLSEWEKARSLGALLTVNKSLRQAEIAKRIGISQGYVSMLLQLLKLPGSVQQFVRDGRLDGATAVRAFSFGGEQMARQAAERRLSRNDMQEIIRAYHELPRKKQKATVKEAAHSGLVTDAGDVWTAAHCATPSSIARVQAQTLIERREIAVNYFTNREPLSAYCGAVIEEPTEQLGPQLVQSHTRFEELMAVAEELLEDLGRLQDASDATLSGLLRELKPLADRVHNLASAPEDEPTDEPGRGRDDHR